MTMAATISHGAAAAMDDRAVRRVVHSFSIEKAEGPHREWISRLASRWVELNERHFEGRLSPAYLAVAEPTASRAYADCSNYSGHGGRLQIRIRPSHVAGTVNQGKQPAPGKTVRFMRPGHDPRARERWLADLLLHEMVHQHEIELLDGKPGHGKQFTAECNRIGEALGLPPVVIRRRKGDPKTLPICSEWPSCVRPKDYYGDLWAEVTAPTEEGEDEVLVLVARFCALSDDGQLRFLTHPAVAAVSLGMFELPPEDEEATANGGDTASDPDRLRDAMARNGGSQNKLAKAADVGQATISRVVNGKPGVSAELISRIIEIAEAGGPDA